MGVKYNGKYIVPAPFASIDTSKTQIDDGRQLGLTYNVTLNGTIISTFSDLSDNTTVTKDAYVSDEALALIIGKQNALRSHLSVDGHELELEGIDDAGSIMFYPTITDISFGEGNWNQLCEYTITMTSKIATDGTDILSEQSGEFASHYLESVRDEYAMDNNEDGSATVTRTISSKGSIVYDPDSPGQLLGSLYPWQRASGWVRGEDSNNIETWYSGVIDTVLPGWNVIDTRVNADVNPLGGEYTIERGWIISNTGVYVTTKSSNEKEDRA